MGLTPEEKKVLKRLQEKAEQPDPPPIGRSLQAVIDLGNADQVKLAKRYGFLPADDDEDEDEGESGDEGDEGDEKPRRRGYFGE